MANATTQSIPANATIEMAPPTQERKQYRDFNNTSFEARIANVEVVERDGDVWASVTAITNLDEDNPGVALVFNSTNGILALARAGHLMTGRRVHVAGVIKGVESHYTTKDGLVVPLKRARIRLVNASVQLGAKPRSEA